jgi:hypothetical protein
MVWTSWSCDAIQKIVEDEIMCNLESVTMTIEYKNNYDQKKEKEKGKIGNLD